MNSATNLYHLDNVIRERVAEKNSYLVKFPSKKEREILKAFLLGRLHKLLCELFHSEIQDKHNYSMECYIMDSKIIQLLIKAQPSSQPCLMKHKDIPSSRQDRPIFRFIRWRHNQKIIHHPNDNQQNHV